MVGDDVPEEGWGQVLGGLIVMMGSGFYSQRSDGILSRLVVTSKSL